MQVLFKNWNELQSLTGYVKKNSQAYPKVNSAQLYWYSGKQFFQQSCNIFEKMINKN